MRRIESIGDRGIWIHSLSPPYLLVDSLGGEPFVALLAVHDRLTIAQRASIARFLVAQGCRRLVVVAGDGPPWKAEIDNANAEHFPGLSVPPGKEVGVQIYAPNAIRDAVHEFLKPPKASNAPPGRFLVIACSAEPRAAGQLERIVAAIARGEYSAVENRAIASVFLDAQFDARDFLSESGRWTATGNLFDAYGQVRPCSREMDLVSRRDRFLLRTWFGDHEVLLSVRPLERGTVATTWSAQHSRLGALDGLISVVDRTILSTFASTDGKHRGAEVYHRVAEDRYEVDGSLFAGPLLTCAWHYGLRRFVDAQNDPIEDPMAGGLSGGVPWY